PGRPLTRQYMEELAEDIDVFLIMYGSNRYRLSCSGAILEALSYRKPIIHLGNECIDFFNQRNCPIGFRCNNINEFVDVMEDLIINYSDRKAVLSDFRDNIDELRGAYSIEASKDKIRESF